MLRMVLNIVWRSAPGLDQLAHLVQEQALAMGLVVRIKMFPRGSDESVMRQWYSQEAPWDGVYVCDYTTNRVLGLNVNFHHILDNYYFAGHKAASERLEEEGEDSLCFAEGLEALARVLPAPKQVVIITPNIGDHSSLSPEKTLAMVIEGIKKINPKLTINVCSNVDINSLTPGSWAIHDRHLHLDKVSEDTVILPLPATMWPMLPQFNNAFPLSEEWKSIVLKDIDTLLKKMLKS